MGDGGPDRRREHGTTKESETERCSRRVLAHARDALLGGAAEMRTCTRDASGGLSLRIRTARSGGDARHDVRARGAVVREIEARMPLSECSVRANMLDGEHEVDVRVPHGALARSRARRVASGRAIPRILAFAAWFCALGAFSVVAATSLHACVLNPSVCRRWVVGQFEEEAKARGDP